MLRRRQPSVSGAYLLGARSMLDARSFMISTLRSQVGFAAAVAHARLRASASHVSSSSGALAAPVWHVASVSSGVRCCNQKSNRVCMALYKQDQVANDEAGWS